MILIPVSNETAFCIVFYLKATCLSDKDNIELFFNCIFAAKSAVSKSVKHLSQKHDISCLFLIFIRHNAVPLVLPHEVSKHLPVKMI